VEAVDEQVADPICEVVDVLLRLRYPFHFHAVLLGPILSHSAQPHYASEHRVAVCLLRSMQSVTVPPARMSSGCSRYSRRFCHGPDHAACDRAARIFIAPGRPGLAQA
jgi:hypothetical protein